MSKDYHAITRDISAYTSEMRKLQPDAMQAFHALSKAAGADGALDKKTKELVALGIAISTRCDGCIGFHVEALVKLGATREEVEETLAMTIYMGGGPSVMYAADAIMAFEQYSALHAGTSA